MDHYYNTVFPAQSLHAFATRSYATANASFNADQREFGTEAVDGTFRRWKACSNPLELKKLVAQHGIGKLNMGAVYERPVSMRFKLPPPSDEAHRTQLIIDVDLTDYSHFAVPKNDLELNDKMFTVVGIAIEFLKDVLEQNFGFKDFWPSTRAVVGRTCMCSIKGPLTLPRTRGARSRPSSLLRTAPFILPRGWRFASSSTFGLPRRRLAATRPSRLASWNSSRTSACGRLATED